MARYPLLIFLLRLMVNMSWTLTELFILFLSMGIMDIRILLWMQVHIMPM